MLPDVKQSMGDGVCDAPRIGTNRLIGPSRLVDPEGPLRRIPLAVTHCLHA
jgi:hypothetical protein